MLHTCVGLTLLTVDTGASSEQLVIIYKTAWCHISQDCSNDWMLLLKLKANYNYQIKY